MAFFEETFNLSESHKTGLKLAGAGLLATVLLGTVNYILPLRGKIIFNVLTITAVGGYVVQRESSRANALAIELNEAMESSRTLLSDLEATHQLIAEQQEIASQAIAISQEIGQEVERLREQLELANEDLESLQHELSVKEQDNIWYECRVKQLEQQLEEPGDSIYPRPELKPGCNFEQSVKAIAGSIPGGNRFKVADILYQLYGVKPNGSASYKQIKDWYKAEAERVKSILAQA